MNILILSTYENKGGAAIAASRLKVALQKTGASVTMLTMRKGSIKGHSWQFICERLIIFLYNLFSLKNLWAVDIACVGEDITKLDAFKQADVVHIHWINQGFLSLKTIEKIAESGKRIVWTMHDAWNSTGICHLTLGCENHRQECGNCKYLAMRGANDLSHRIWKRKASLYAKSNIRFVTCSEWLRREVMQSKLMGKQNVVAIPNPIDTACFYPEEKKVSRQVLALPEDKQLLLFVAQDVNNHNKGMQYLIDAIKHTENEKLALVMLGGRASQLEEALNGIDVYALGYVTDTDTIRHVYNAADAFVLPSLSENLPNTIMEAMACGTPCVGFKVGGIPEMISHKKNGYVAEYRNARDLALGINYVIDENNAQRLKENCVQYVSDNYAEDVVAKKYIELMTEE